jgi:hypothetical protein
MTQAHRKGQARMAMGMSALAVASIMLTRHQSDYLSGLAFGIGIGLLMLGIRTLTRP